MISPQTPIQSSQLLSSFPYFKISLPNPLQPISPPEISCTAHHNILELKSIRKLNKMNEKWEVPSFNRHVCRLCTQDNIQQLSTKYLYREMRVCSAGVVSSKRPSPWYWTSHFVTNHCHSENYNVKFKKKRHVARTWYQYDSNDVASVSCLQAFKRQVSAFWVANETSATVRESASDSICTESHVKQWHLDGAKTLLYASS